MYDNICKFLAQEFPNDLATWLLGFPVALTELSPTELSNEPIRADSLILQQSDDLVLHTEFQTKPDVDIPFRMIDYRLRVYRRFPQKEMRQMVIYLKETGSDLVRQNNFSLTRTRHEFEVICLWEQPTEIFLNAPGLLPFAVLSRTENPTTVLSQVAEVIEGITEQRVQDNVAASAAILAGLVLEQNIIRRILRSEIMRESVVYQEILREGRQEAKEQVALNMLRDGMSNEQVVKLTELSLEQLQSLRNVVEAENQHNS